MDEKYEKKSGQVIIGKKVKDRIKKAILKIVLKYVVLTALIIIIISCFTYYLFNLDGIWDDEDTLQPSSYINNVKVTGNGLEIDKYAIISEALKSEGYSDEQIDQIRADLEDEGYTGEELDKKFAEKAIKILGIEGITDIDDTSAAEILWELDEETYTPYLDDYEELEYLLNAELVTQMPYIDNLSSDDALNGVIYFDRHKIDGSTVRLQYIDESTFNQKIANVDSSALNYFTISDNGQAKIAYWSEETGQATINDDETLIDISKYDSRFTNDNLTYTNLQYYSTDVIYSIPQTCNLSFEYLWVLLVMSEDYDGFVKGLADLAYESEIIVSIYDSITEETTDIDYAYTRERKDYSKVKQQDVKITQSVDLATANNLTSTGWIIDPEKVVINTSSEVDSEEQGEVDSDSKEEHSINVKITTSSNSTTYKMTYANVWMAEYTTQYNQVTSGDRSRPDDLEPTISNLQIEDEEQEVEGSKKENQIIKKETTQDSIIRTWNRIYSEDNNLNSYLLPVEIDEIYITSYIGDTWSTYLTSDAEISQYDYSYSSMYINDPSKTNTIEKIDPDGFLDESNNVISETFPSLLRKSANIEFITKNSEWLIDLLEENELTDMINITKYMINMALGDVYEDVEEFDFDSFFTTEFTTISSGSQVAAFIAAWENTQADTSSKYFEGDYYKVYPEKSTLNIYCGIKIYGEGKYYHTEVFQRYGVDITQVVNDYNSEGKALIEKSIVKAVYAELINEFKQATINCIESQGLHLEDYQYDALTSISYHFGSESCKNLPEVYNQCGGATEEFKNTWTCSYIQNHPDDGPTSFNRTKNNWEIKRSAAEWLLFTEGKYTDSEGNEIIVQSSEGATNSESIFDEVTFDNTPGGIVAQKALELKRFIVKDGNFTYEWNHSYILTLTSSQRGIDCSAYVSWVLRESGVCTASYINNSGGMFDGGIPNCTLVQHAKGKNIDVSAIQPGDIIVYDGHVEICMGGTKTLGCGSNSSINSNGYQSISTFTTTWKSENNVHLEDTDTKVYRPNKIN